jgi:hypothetical protein
MLLQKNGKKSYKKKVIRLNKLTVYSAKFSHINLKKGMKKESKRNEM